VEYPDGLDGLPAGFEDCVLGSQGGMAHLLGQRHPAQTTVS
jgi:hypothetical protein